MTDLAPELARLSPRQRLDLIEFLWESLDDEDLPVTDTQRAELDQRIADSVVGHIWFRGAC
jgi:putative addiction module component (TIGR02574 family)